MKTESFIDIQEFCGNMQKKFYIFMFTAYKSTINKVIEIQK